MPCWKRWIRYYPRSEQLFDLHLNISTQHIYPKCTQFIMMTSLNIYSHSDHFIEIYCVNPVWLLCQAHLQVRVPKKAFPNSIAFSLSAYTALNVHFSHKKLCVTGGRWKETSFRKIVVYTSQVLEFCLKKFLLIF